MRKAVAFSIGSMNSEGMLSKNPKAGIHETDVARTIDANGSNPGGYQGGDIVVVCQTPDGGVSKRSILPDFKTQEEDGGTGAKRQKR